MAEKKIETKEIESAWIRELAGILDEAGLTEIEVEKSGMRLRVSRAAAGPVAHQPAPMVAAALPTQNTVDAPPAEPIASHVGAVPSPMVGTAYLSPSPGADAFIKIGDRVSEGQTLMIIEAMKTMNPITSPRSGVVKEIIAQDAQPVEFGEALLILE